jgi:asparagine synthase (glutamine-hydrolysing)
MCGILGIINKNIEHSEFAAILTRLAHRGPDGYGIWQEERVSIGHRRLSIIDLSDRAKQPFEILDRYVLTFNGEIYNYLEIKQQLSLKGYSFRSDSDTEVLLAAFVEWGPDCLKKFNGMWAFAIWDKKEKTLFLSRDRMGEKPLFYIQTEEFFAFASEMKALYPLLQRVEINHKVMDLFKSNPFSYEITEDCLIKNIKRFPAAHYGVVKNNRLSQTKYWYPLEELSPVPVRYEEQCELFRELFLDACKIRMRSDVPLGTALSGGIDSSATICAMHAISSKDQLKNNNTSWQNAFIASFPGTELDETEYALKVTNHIGIPAINLVIDPLQEIDKLFYYSYLFEELYIASPIPFIQLYGKIKRSGVTVTLDGHGGDELFGGYPFDFIQKIKDDFLNPLLINSTIETYYHTFDTNPGPYQYLKHYKDHLGWLLSGRSLKKNPQFDHLNNQLYHSTFESVLPTLLRNYDRYSMINGVEIRMPFLDHRIVSFAFSIPGSSKIRNGFSKAIVRDSLRDLLPSAIAQRKSKVGFSSPTTQWFKGPLNQWIMDELNSNSFKLSTLIDQREVKDQIINKVIRNPNANYSDGEKAWRLLMPYIWEKSLRYISNGK